MRKAVARKKVPRKSVSKARPVAKARPKAKSKLSKKSDKSIKLTAKSEKIKGKAKGKSKAPSSRSKPKQKQNQRHASRPKSRAVTARTSARTTKPKALGNKGSRRQSSPQPRARLVHPARTALIKQYEAAVRLLYRQDFEKARVAFEKVIQTDGQDKEISERALTHLRLCEQKIAHKPPAPKTMEEHYNVAVALMNSGRYDESIDHLNRALRQNPKCDYVIYALAVSNCRLGDTESALKNLKLAINLRPENRFLAQRDTDFEPLMRDSRFISMVFPDRPAAATS